MVYFSFLFLDCCRWFFDDFWLFFIDFFEVYVRLIFVIQSGHISCGQVKQEKAEKSRDRWSYHAEAHIALYIDEEFYEGFHCIEDGLTPGKGNGEAQGEYNEHSDLFPELFSHYIWAYEESIEVFFYCHVRFNLYFA